jgi:5-methylcytosine-specific restriction endonuclease McrA
MLPRLPRIARQQSRPSVNQFRGARHKRAIKRATMRDCGRRCVYCATALDFETATLDHVYPLAHGGVHHPGNVVLACTQCNQLKSDQLPYAVCAAYPWAGANFMRYARTVHRALKRTARRAVSLAYAEAA